MGLGQRPARGVGCPPEGLPSGGSLGASALGPTVVVGLMPRQLTRGFCLVGGGTPRWDIREGGSGLWHCLHPHGRSCEAPPRTTRSLRRNVDPPVWYDTDVKLFEIQRV